MLNNTLRSVARKVVADSVPEAAAFSHRQNYRKLHVYRDGDVHWTEHINQSDGIIDSGADRFAPVPSVACEGTGSYVCNCDFCNDVYSERDEQDAIQEGRKYDKTDKYSDQEAAIADAVCDSDMSMLEAGMLAAFDAIPLGYFNDEEDHA